MTLVVSEIDKIRQLVKDWKKQNLSVGLVPTMGALHDGHASLIKKCTQSCKKTIVSIFVNPTQFGINEDFSKYPRTLETDLAVCEKNSVDVIFAPSVEEMYGVKKSGRELLSDKYLTLVCPPYSLVDALCGKSRPGHFDGVATVVTKLFNITACDEAFFGQKDAQQLIIIEKIVKDLNLPVKIISCPIVREKSGLAMSSRNSYLSDTAKDKAAILSTVLFSIKNSYLKGITDVDTLINSALEMIPDDIEPEYLEIFDYETLEKPDPSAAENKKLLTAIAAKIDEVRLIDNVIL